jgi:hypothetical protein
MLVRDQLLEERGLPTAGHLIAVQTDGMGGEVALLSHTDASAVALVDIVDEKSCKDRVCRSQRRESGRKKGNRTHVWSNGISGQPYEKETTGPEVILKNEANAAWDSVEGVDSLVAKIVLNFLRERGERRKTKALQPNLSLAQV